MNANLCKERDALKAQLKEQEKQELANEKEKYWNNKYPKIKKYYIRHETDGDYQIDVRNFFTPFDSKLPYISGKDDDEKALKALQWVIKKIRYTSDKSEYGYNEYWAYPYQTLKRKKGDCDDGAILLANIMLRSGIPYWKIRINAGLVSYKGKSAGHAYVTYYCSSNKKWVLLDWCYYPDRVTPVAKRKDYKFNKVYQDVWFSFNQRYAFGFGTKADYKIED